MVAIGGRTGRSKNLHFAPKPKHRLPLKMLAAVLLLVVLAAGAGLAKAAAAAEPALTETRSLPSTETLPGSAPRPAWPAGGEAALEVQGLPALGSSGPSTPLPIASLAKVMTAYVILRDHPLHPGQSGFSVTVSAAEVADYNQELATSQSVVPVAAGEHLTELQLLQGLLVASGNNLATILADVDAGSTAAFVAKMQAAARELGMTHTTYTDPSGLAGTTVSTAADQLLLAAKAMADPVFASTVAMSTVTLPVAGKLANFNTAVGTGGYVGIKTGSDSPAGGCLLFANRRSSGGRPYTILGAVLDQAPGQQSTTALIDAAISSADALVHSVTSAVSVKTVLPAGTVVAVATNAQGRHVPLATTAPLTVLGYGGMTVPLSVSIPPLGSELRAGQAAGRVSIPGGPSTTVRVTSALPPVSFGWKVLHDY